MTVPITTNEFCEWWHAATDSSAARDLSHSIRFWAVTVPHLTETYGPRADGRSRGHAASTGRRRVPAQ